MRATKENILVFLKEIKDGLLKDGIEKITLFGSFVTQKNNLYSDIYIASAKEKDYLKNRDTYSYINEVQKIKNLLQAKFHGNIDVFDLDSDSVMKKNITKDLAYV